MEQSLKVKKKEFKSLFLENKIPENIEISYVDNILIVKGPKGTISKKLRYPRVEFKIETDKILVGTVRLTKREKKIIFTYNAHLKNMIFGVLNGYEYNLVVLYAKFPITIELKNNVFSVKNLLGEKVPRTVKIPEGIKIDVKGKKISVFGIDKELTGQVAGSLEQSCKITNLDRRVIQDGIYITDKPKKVVL